MKISYCNMCGSQIEDQEDMGDIFIPEFTIGLGSKYDGMECDQIDLCVECMDDFLDSLDISPFKNE